MPLPARSLATAVAFLACVLVTIAVCSSPSAPQDDETELGIVSAVASEVKSVAAKAVTAVKSVVTSGGGGANKSSASSTSHSSSSGSKSGSSSSSTPKSEASSGKSSGGGSKSSSSGGGSSSKSGNSKSSSSHDDRDHHHHHERDNGDDSAGLTKVETKLFKTMRAQERLKRKYDAEIRALQGSVKILEGEEKQHHRRPKHHHREHHHQHEQHHHKEEEEKREKNTADAMPTLLVVKKPLNPEVEHCKPFREQLDSPADVHKIVLEKTMCTVDKLIGRILTQLDLEGYEQHGDFVVRRIVDQDVFYLRIVGAPNHKITVILKGSDGYVKEMHGYGEIYSGAIHAAARNTWEYLECRDEVTGSIEWFRFVM